MFKAIGSLRKEKVPLGMAVDTLKIPGMSQIDNSMLVRQGEDASRLHLIADMSRIGVRLFNVKMEYTYFKPRSGKNFLFELILLRWPDSTGILWAVCSFPVEYRAKAEVLAEECGLRLADGIPTLLDEVGAHQFPLSGPTAYTLENVSGHKVYDNDADAYEKLKKEESAAIDAILDADRAVLVHDMKELGYTNAQITKILHEWDSGNEEYDEPPEKAPQKS